MIVPTTLCVNLHVLVHHSFHLLHEISNKMRSDLHQLCKEGIISRHEAQYVLIHVSVVAYTNTGLKVFHEHAVDFLESALELSETQQERVYILFRIAYVWSTRNDPRAITALEQILVHDPTNEHAIKNLEMIRSSPQINEHLNI